MQLESILITLDSLSMSSLEKRGPTDFLPIISKPRRAESPIFIAKDDRLKSSSGLKTSPVYQAFLWHISECCINSDMDSHL